MFLMNTIKPILSVIIPVFNTENYLARCLDSIINQSIKNIEILVSNDLSTDNSEKIILDYVKRYDFIKYFKMQSKGGAGGARNLSLDHVSGQYIGFVDSDDWVDTLMFEKLINSIENSNADIAICGIITEYNNLHDSVMRYEYASDNVIDGKLAFELLTRKSNNDVYITPMISNKVYTTKFIKDNKYTFLSNTCNEDDVFTFICFLNVEKVAITANTYYHYQQRANSITHSFSNKNMDDLINGFSIIKNYLDSTNSYQLYKGNYYAFFEKCLESVLNILMDTEPNEILQNNYINYLFSKSQNSLIINDYIEYVGAKRIKKFLMPSLTR